MPRSVDTQEHSDDSFQVPIKQKLLNLPNQACEACGTFKSNHPTMTSALMLIAVFCLGIVTSAAVGKLFVSNQHYYVSTDPHAREIHQALDTLLSHYRGGRDAVVDSMNAAQHTAKSYYHGAKGAVEGSLAGGKEGVLAGVESGRASLDSAKASLEGMMGGLGLGSLGHKSTLDKARDSVSSRLSDASAYASDSLASAKDSLLHGKDALNEKIQDTLHPDRHENQFMKMVHEAENKIANFIKQRA